MAEGVSFSAIFLATIIGLVSICIYPFSVRPLLFSFSGKPGPALYQPGPGAALAG